MSSPLLIAVVSGKGGVGKTMLSVAIACEMARGSRTLLIDLDFFNRGLTGLFASMVARSPCRPVEPPQELVSTVEPEDWVIADVAQNLCVLSYGDLDRASSGGLETMDVHELARHLGGFIERACAIANCDVAILDCHGGPDSTSFAACMLARRTILVSEPDKITLYGTLHFLRTLASMLPDRKPDIRLVFNKVIPAFSARFLLRFYRRFLAREFAGHALLAIYPLEAHLTKAFERTPFLTTVYPTSQLATKTRLLLRELLATEAPELLPAEVRKRSRIGRAFDRYYMGRWLALFDPNAVTRIFGVLVVLVFVLPNVAGAVNRTLHMPMLASLAGILEIKYADVPLPVWVSTIGLVWLLIVLMLRSCRDLDIFTTYSIRTGSVLGASIGAASLFALGALWGLGAAATARSAWKGHNTHPAEFVAGQLSVVTAVALPLLLCLSWYVGRGIRSMRYDRRFLEGGFRLAYCASVVLAAVLLASALS